MKYFMSLLWVTITLFAIYSIQLYIQSQHLAPNFYSASIPQTKCLQYLNPKNNLNQQQQKKQRVKLCVHCINAKTMFEDRNVRSPFEINSTVLVNRQTSFSNYQSRLMGLEIRRQNHGLSCEELLQFVDVQQIQTQGLIKMEKNMYSERILQLLQGSFTTISPPQKIFKSEFFSLHPHNSALYTIFQAIHLTQQSSQSSFLFKPTQTHIRYLNKPYLLQIFKRVFNLALISLLLIGVMIIFLEKMRNRQLSNYTVLGVSILVLYAGIFMHLNDLKLEKQEILPLCWGVFLWICLIKIDRVDIEKYKTRTITKLLIAVTGAFAIHLTNHTGNKLYEGTFFAILLIGYLIFYKFLIRIWCSNQDSFNPSTINTLAYLCLILAVILQTTVIQSMYGLRFLRQLQIFRYGNLIITSIIILILTYFEYQKKLQRFEQYQQAKGIKINIQQSQLQELQASP